ncbi:MAG: 6-phosphogluconolactonase [Chitinophagaceae bacterium]|nr:6-phosphogluconolactonase [Chitinophagaceae bacterium]
MSLNIYQSVDELIKIMADDLMKKVNAAIDNAGECNVVLSGGSSPGRLYELLASYPYKSEINWDNIYFFFGDERCVPFNDPANNGLMVKKTLFEPLKIADSRIFYISTLQTPEEAARKYAKRIIAHFRDKPIRFDLILLGLGDDAHTASLFPHTTVLREQKALVSAVHLEKPTSSRITMTAPLINEAQDIFFLVYGENKAQAVKNVLEGVKNQDEYPAQLIHPEDGNIHWFLDEHAARLLDRVSG